MQKQAVMQDVDVFEVGKDWAWHAFGWRGLPLGRLKNTCNADSMAKGKWLVVSTCARFDNANGVVYIDASFGSLSAARCWLREQMRMEDAAMYKYGYVYGVEYEIWHVVDDEQLWGEWEQAVKDAESLRMLRDAELMENERYPELYNKLAHVSRLYRNFQIEDERMRARGVNVLEYVRLDQLEHKAETVEVAIFGTYTGDMLSFTRLHVTDNVRIRRYLDMATGNDVARSRIAANIIKVRYYDYGFYCTTMVEQHKPISECTEGVYAEDIPF